MSIARRGIFGMVAALPFAPKASAASQAAAREVRMGLSVAAPDFTDFQEAILRDLDAARGGNAEAVSKVFREHLDRPGQIVSGADVQDDRVVIAPYGWDTLENVR